MALPALSTEQNIRKKLAALDCSESAFARFNGVVKRTRFFEAMTGRPCKHFDERTATKLLEIISEMETLQAETPVPINWGHGSRIEFELVRRRIAAIGGIENGTETTKTAA